MTVVAVLLLGLGIWLVDSAVRGRAPMQTLKDVVSTGNLNPVSANVPSKPVPQTDTGAPNKGAPVSGTVSQWIDQAAAVLQANGVPASKIDKNAIAIIIQGESSGDPHAENDWDINAKEGHPSQGLMQTIGPTFDAYAVPGHTNIWNPVDNIVAATRYALSRYGSLSNVPGVIQVRSGGSYTAGY